LGDSTSAPPSLLPPAVPHPAPAPPYRLTRRGAAVQVEGKDLGTGAGHLQIDIGGIECIDSTWVSGARVTCTTPPGAGAGERVTVRIDGQYTASSSGAALFSYNAPEVRSVAPTRGAVGGGDRLLVQVPPPLVLSGHAASLTPY
jgi:hypothetical protein